MSSFDTYKWNEDEGWKTYAHNVTIPAGEDEVKVMERLKRKYYKRNIDANYDDTTPSPSPSTPLSSSASTTNTARSNPGTPPSAQSAPSFLSLQNIWLMAHASVILNSVLYLLPFFSREGSVAYYRTALMAGVVVYGSVLWQLFGAGYYTPTSSARAKDNVYYLLYCACFLIVPPSLLALVPLVIYSYYQISDQIYGPLTRVPVLGRLVAKARTYNQQALFSAAYVEVMIGGLLVFQAIGGVVSLLALIVYWQFMTYRFNTSQPSKAILEMLTARLETLVTHRWCPSLIQSFYRKACSFFHQFASFDRSRP